MIMNKTIQQVGEMVGIPAKETDQILVQVRANTAKLEGCEGPHDFSIALDRYTKQPIENPTPQQHFGCKWKCSKCGGYVDAINKSWYNRALKDGRRAAMAEAAEIAGNYSQMIDPAPTPERIKRAIISAIDTPK
jgi:hypothetical protein